MAGILAAAGIELLTLFPAYFKPFLAPETVNPLEIDYPVSFSQFDCDPAITVSRMLDMQLKQFLDYRLILVRQFRLIPLSTSSLP